MRSAWLVVVALAACGDGRAAAPDGPTVDAAVFEPGPNLVTIYVTDDTTDVFYRHGDSGLWGEAEMVSATEYRIHVEDAYEVIAMCGLYTQADTTLHARTFADGDTDSLYCSTAFLASTPGYVQVMGQMLQPGFVTMWDYDASTTAPWTFTLNVLKGDHDLLALDSSNRLAIRRSITIDTPTTVATVDMAQEGVATLTRPFSVSSIEVGEMLSVQTDLLTKYEYLPIPGSPTELREAPPSLLQPGDLQFVYVSADTVNTNRTATFGLGDASSVQLMPVLPRNAFVYSVPDNNTLRADFTGLPAFTSIDMFLYDGRSSQSANWTKSWFEATGHDYIRMSFPPYVEPRWRVSLTPEYYRYVYVNDETGLVSRWTERRDDVTNVLGN